MHTYTELNSLGAFFFRGTTPGGLVHPLPHSGQELTASRRPAPFRFPTTEFERVLELASTLAYQGITSAYQSVGGPRLRLPAGSDTPAGSRPPALAKDLQQFAELLETALLFCAALVDPQRETVNEVTAGGGLKDPMALSGSIAEVARRILHTCSVWQLSADGLSIAEVGTLENLRGAVIGVRPPGTPVIPRTTQP